MRPLFATFSAILISFLMLSSVIALEHPMEPQVELEDSDSEVIQFTSGRSSSKAFIASGGSSTQSIDAEYIEPDPNGGWIIGSEYNTTLTFGTKTLQPTSPYSSSYGEFFLATVDSTGTWQSVFGADHSFGSGGLSYLTDVAVDVGGEILITGYFYGEISFGGGGGGPAVVLSNTNTGYHFEGFMAKADPMGNWLWANSFTTIVNGSGEYSSTTVAQINTMGDVLISGQFQGETDFGGSILNVSSTQIYVAKYDGRNGVLNWVVSGGGIGTNQVIDMAVTSSGGVKVATITDGFSQWSTSSYVAAGTLDAAIVELDTNGGVVNLNGIGASAQQTVVTQIEIDSSGDTYYAGTFGGTISSGGWTATATYGGNDVFVARSAVSTSNSWAFVSGSSAEDEPWALAVTSNGLVTYGGYFATAFTAGSTTLSPSNHDGYVIGLSSTGSLDWTERVGGSQYDYVWSMSVNMSDYIGIGGSYSGSMTHEGSTLTSTGGRDAYVWVFDPSSLKDSDGDSIVDVDDNCPTVSNPGQANTDGDQQGDECDSDDDNDGLTDNFPDLCPRNSEFNWTSMQDTANPSASTDWDNDGCKDDVEDADDDNDQVLDVNDLCPYTSYDPPRPTWISDTATNDIDGDGCRDSDEDVDDDADGFNDVNDDCPTLAGTSTLGTTGCVDTDSDGWSDTTDDCPNEAGNSTLGGKNACPDNDGDGWSNADDAFPDEPTQWADADSDGFGDNSLGVSPDDCNDVAGTSTLDRLGCFDADEDGYSNADSEWFIGDGADSFPNDPTQWSDFDDDGYGDNWANSSWDDRKSSWPGEMFTDATSQDACPTRAGDSWRADTLGCPDADGDGWYDLMDAFMNDATQWEDADMDGYGDNTSGNEPDACPTIPGNSTTDRFGCIDSDGDGYSNPDIAWGLDMGGDAFPNEPTQWGDGDGDGYGENPAGVTPDDCPTVRDSSNIDRYGCADTDGDGISDPDDTWTLADGADACVAGAGNSTNDRIGCFDGDGDGYSNPTADWTVAEGADAYPDDPLRWIKEKSSSDGASSSNAVLYGISAVVVLAVIGGLAFMFTRKSDDEAGEVKSWDDGTFAPMGGAPAVPNMGAQPAVMMPNYSNTAAPVAGMPNMQAQPAAAAVAMPNFSAQPAAAQPVAAVPAAVAPVAQPAPVQPDPAREYYNGLIAQGYPQPSALQYTQQYYPTFQG